MLNQCVKYSDLKRSNISFKAYFGVWNDLGSKINNLKIEAAISTDTTSNTWTSIGSTTIDIKSNSKRADSFTCTIPSSIDLSKTYYLSVYCGSTSSTKSWSTKIAKNDAATMGAAGYTYVGDVTSARIYFGELVDILSSQVAGSNNKLRTENKAALFRIQPK